MNKKNLNPPKADLQNDRLTLSPQQIHFLLYDRNKNYLHTLIAHCVQQCIAWKHIVRTLEKKIPIHVPKISHAKFFSVLVDRDAIDLQELDYLAKMRKTMSLQNINQLIEQFINARYMLRLWQHQLKTLEMICDATHLLELEKKCAKQKYKPPSYQK